MKPTNQSAVERLAAHKLKRIAMWKSVRDEITEWVTIIFIAVVFVGVGLGICIAIDEGYSFIERTNADHEKIEKLEQMIQQDRLNDLSKAVEKMWSNTGGICIVDKPVAIQTNGFDWKKLTIRQTNNIVR